MADPLAALAEREVPSKTNFFDPREARTIISRYADTRAERPAAKELADSAVQFSRLQEDRARAARDAVMQGREDEDYQTRKEALARQGEFLSSLNEIDPEAPDYDAKVTEFMVGLPEGLHDDPAVKSIFTFKNQVADDARRRRDAESAKNQSFENQLTMFRERAKFNSALKGITDDDVREATLPDGTLDMLAIGMKAGERERGYKEGEFNRKLNAVNEGRIKVLEAADLSKRGRERRSTVDQFIVEDRTAFPRQIDTLVAQYLKDNPGKKSVDPALLEVNPKYRDQYLKAKTWDAKPRDSELSAAFAYDDPEKYVNLVPGLNDSQKERRRMVWEHAHRDGAVEESDISPQNSPNASADGQPLTTGGASKPLDQAAKDWLNANPDDPRAPAIRKKLGL